jgi:hypothetical protein
MRISSTSLLINFMQIFMATAKASSGWIRESSCMVKRKEKARRVHENLFAIKVS